MFFEKNIAGKELRLFDISKEISNKLFRRVVICKKQKKKENKNAETLKYIDSSFSQVQSKKAVRSIDLVLMETVGFKFHIPIFLGNL